MKHLYNFKLLKTQSLYLLFFFVLTYSGTGFAQVSDCPELAGGAKNIELSNTPQYAFPSDYSTKMIDYPSYTTITRATAGGISTAADLNTTSQPARVLIDPTMNGTTRGVVVIQFLGTFELLSGESVVIYSLETGVPVVQRTLTSGDNNDAPYTSLVVNGPALIEYVGEPKQIATDEGPEYYTFMRYITGDHSFTTIANRHSAIWKSFIASNSYAVVDDTFYGGGNGLPVITAFFDDSKNYVSSVSAFCLDIWKKIPSIMIDQENIPAFPGQIRYSRESDEDFNIDNTPGHDEADQLTAARILWLLSQNTTDNEGIQYAIWAFQGETSLQNEWNTQAIAAVSNVPAEPEPFTLGLAIDAVNGVEVKNTIRVRLQFPVSFENLVLSMPSEVEVKTVTGGSHDPTTGELTVTSSTIDIDLVSETAGKFNIQAIYDNDTYFNIKNLNIYHPCGDTYQRFLHVGEKNRARPFRSIELEWSAALPVTLVNFNVKQVEDVIALNWTTTDEKGFSHFEIEGGKDIYSFQLLGEVTANETKNYSFVDNAKIIGSRYYRLKMVDLDGTYTYSLIRSIDVTSKESLIALYPNPATDYVRVNSDQVENVAIYNIAGGRVTERKTGLGSSIDITGLSTGIYLAVLHLRGGQQISQQISVQR